MNAETINETINVCKYVGHERKARTIEGEIVLQDIKPDILSIVKVTRELCIHHKMVGENKVKIEGHLDICLIYIADDDTNSQRAMNSKIDFSEVIDFTGVNEESIIKLKYEVGNVEYRVLNGRKVSIKIPVIFDVKAFNNCDINIVKGIMNDEDMQVQRMNQNLCSPIIQNSSDVELKENIKLNESNSPIGEILCCNICITDKEYKLSYNKILAKADANIKIIYIADNERQNVDTFETSIPVMGFVDFDGVNDNSIISMEYDILDYCIRPTYQDMQSNAISVEANIKVIAYAYETRKVELITDFYTPNFVLNTECQTNNVVKSIVDINENIELAQTLVVPELDNTNILSIEGNSTINEKNILNGKIAVAGNVDINILYCKKDSRIIENKRLELPFQQVIKNDDISNGMDPIINTSIENIEYKQNGENQIQVKIRLVVTIIADKEENINNVTKLEITDEEVPKMASVVVYFVKPGDTLWNIAKKFRSTVQYITEVNNLNSETIYPGQRLLIPRLQINKTSNLLR